MLSDIRKALVALAFVLAACAWMMTMFVFILLVVLP